MKIDLSLIKKLHDNGEFMTIEMECGAVLHLPSKKNGDNVDVSMSLVFEDTDGQGYDKYLLIDPME